MNVAIIVLAAGYSRRLGRPKQAIELEGETLLERSARIARDASLGPVFVVVNRHAGIAGIDKSGFFAIVVNDYAAEGIAASIRAGVEAAQSRPDLDGLLLMTCDQVGLTSAHLRLLCEDAHSITGSAYAGRVGVPAYFPIESVSDLLALRGDRGARELLHRVRAVRAEELALDIDTEQDIARLRTMMKDRNSLA